MNEDTNLQITPQPPLVIPDVIGCLSFFNADNLEIMRGFKDNEFDLAIVDPPYGLERFKANDGGNSKKITTFGDKDKNWNNIKPDAEYWDQLFRVSKNQIVWGGNNFDLPTSEYFIVWDKGQMMPSFARCEMAWTNCKVPAKMYAKRSQDLERIHPTQKPTDLYSWLLINYAKEGFKILDTHLGSGTIAIAVEKANRLDKMNLQFVGIEIDKEYYEKALNRIEQYCRQGTLSF
jgi:site-specific DNA-methyltransferase (adenine-specific)